MTITLSKTVPSVISMTLAILISPADAQTSSTTCTSTSYQCCWVKRIWQLMGKTTSVSSTSATACCYYLGSTTQTSGILGVTCTSTGIVTKIRWGSQSLRYSIPTELSNLKDLTYLQLSGNQLTGSIPTVLGNLVKLQTLLLGNNQLNGTIPSLLGNLSDLERLYLDSNQLTGEIPVAIRKLVNLRELFLYNNKLNGTIPKEIGELKNLAKIYLGRNQLTGEIPSSFGNLSNLEDLRLPNNTLSGIIPSSLGNLLNLAHLYVCWNTGLNGTFTPRNYTILGVIPNITVIGTNVTICGSASAYNPPATYPLAACLASDPALTLTKRILAFSQVIGSFKYTCNTDSNKNPYADCLNSIAKICNTTDSSFVKANCHTGVNMMYGNMSTHWQAVRKECGQWKWTDQSIGNNASSNCATANSNLIAKAYYTVWNSQTVAYENISVTLGLTESIKVQLWSNALLK